MDYAPPSKRPILKCMVPDNEPTMAFGVSKYLVSVEGPSSTLGLLISMLYDEPGLPRTHWSVSHTAANRPAFVKQLRLAGTKPRRIGMAVHTQEAVDRITRHAGRLRLVYHCLTTNADLAPPPGERARPSR